MPPYYLVRSPFLHGPGAQPDHYWQIMWTMQLYQLALTTASPAFIAIALYEATRHVILRWPG